MYVLWRVMPEVEPWPEEVDGDALLDDLIAAFRKYIVIEPNGLRILALWTVHTYCFDHWQNTPRLYISSPKRRSGKSRVLDVLDCIVSRPIRADAWFPITRRSPTSARIAALPSARSVPSSSRSAVS
jgi:hypothetical protein